MINANNFFRSGTNPPLPIRKAMTEYVLFKSLNLPLKPAHIPATGYDDQQFFFTEIIRNNGNDIMLFDWCVEHEICDSTDLDIWLFLQGEIFVAQMEREQGIGI
jgi:hypothetical protein